MASHVRIIAQMKLRKPILLLITMLLLTAGMFAMRSFSKSCDCDNAARPETMEEETPSRRMPWEGLSNQFFSSF